MKNNKFYLIITFILFIMFNSNAEASDLTVNMLVKQSTGSMFLNSSSRIEINANNEVYHVDKNKMIEVMLIPGSRKLLLFVDKRLYLSSKEFKINSKNEFRIESIDYPVGSTKGLHFFVEKNKIQCILKISIQDYLKGVLYAEMGNSISLTALKAQAVASRTYVLYNMDKLGIAYKNHVPSNTLGQVYKQGKFSGNIEKAVRETKGEILTYKNKPLLALYSSCCGGVTENCAEVFGGDEKPYLISKRDHLYLKKLKMKTENLIRNYKNSNCQTTVNYRWKREFTDVDISKKLKLDYKLNGLSVKEYTSSGRIKTVLITAGPEIKRIPATLLRKKLKLPSTFFYIDHEKSSLVYRFIGGGHGHGCGMCQNGAIGMAASGKNYKEILNFYYQGSKIIKLY